MSLKCLKRFNLYRAKKAGCADRKRSAIRRTVNFAPANLVLSGAVPKKPAVRIGNARQPAGP